MDKGRPVAYFGLPEISDAYMNLAQKLIEKIEQ